MPPHDAEYWRELGSQLRHQGELAAAAEALGRALALAPADARAWFDLAAVEVAQGETARGIGSYRKALELRPDFAEAWSNLGEALGASGDKPGEIEAYRRAVGFGPRLAPAWSNLGSALLESGQIEEALLACRRATELDPEFAPAWNNLGNALHQCGRHEEAVRACESALRHARGSAEAWGSLGAALHALGRYDDAIRAQRNAIEISPGNAHHHYNLGLSLQHCGRMAEAITSFRAALALDPDHVPANWNLSFTLLASGELAEGWDRYEWRWRRRDAVAKRYDFTPWDGDASKPCRLLLWGEQGVGDEIMHASMVPELASAPLSVTLETDARLAPLFARSLRGVTVIPRRDPPAEGPSAHDFQMPLGSLGCRLRRSFGSFPRHRGYLIADRSRAAALRKRLLGDGADRLVGVSWKSANREFGALKSNSLPDWMGILRVAQLRFVDLQYGETAAERERVEQQAGPHIEHLQDLDLYGDLDGLAALCAACDLVITVSNVTAHVAGALGRPVWLLLPQANGRLWYWFTGRTDSPWYPSMRIFTQHSLGSWRGVLDEVARELAAFAGVG